MEANALPKRSGITTNVLYPLDNKTKVFTLFRKVQGAMHNVPAKLFWMPSWKKWMPKTAL
jgi:hypothetical protein